MRKVLIALLISVSVISYGQGNVFKENKVDEMLGHRVLITNWVQLEMGWSTMYHARLRLAGDVILMDIKVVTKKVVSVPEGALFIIKTFNEDIIKLKSHDYVIAERGKGAVGLNSSGVQGIDPTYIIDKEILKKIEDEGIMKLRVYLSDSYIETKSLNKNKSKKFQEYCAAFLDKL